MKYFALFPIQIITILGQLAIATPVFASTGYSTNAVYDGIGYRSNLIDPFNPYAAGKSRMLQALLNRYGLLPSERDSLSGEEFGSITGPKYIDHIRSMLSRGFPDLDSLKVPAYHYNFGICQTNGYPSALSFMAAAVQSLGKTPDVDELIRARHRLLFICNLDETERTVRTRKLLKPVRAMLKTRSLAPWVKYLEAAVSFYETKFDIAEGIYGSLSRDNSGWLKDTADYMAVRIAKAKVDATRFVDQILKRPKAINDLGVAIKKYLTAHPKGHYVETARALNRYRYSASNDRNRLIAATQSDFIRAFDPRAPAKLGQRIRVFNEGSNFTAAIFEFPRSKGALYQMHPLAVVAALLAGIADGKGDLSKTDNQNLHSLFYDSPINYSLFSGLRYYFNLVILSRVGAFRKITEAEFNENFLGPLYGDALILKARALMKTGRHLEAAKLWLEISQRNPIYNALTEAATAYVRTGRFSDFARIEKSWMTDLSLKPSSKSETNDNSEFRGYKVDEFSISVKTFHAEYQPYRNLLIRGFSSINNVDENKSVYSDTALHPVIRFIAAEPILRDGLLKGNYKNFIKVAETVFDTAFYNKWIETDGGHEKILITAYRLLIPKVKDLLRNENDPEALTEIGYFLYSQHRFPGCFGITLWEKKIGLCKEDPAEGNVEGYLRPINMFSKALKLYSALPSRTYSEARLLRILIYCFKSYTNRAACLRGPIQQFPQSIRRGYFQRLHKFFPIVAKRTPYWY